MFKAIKNRRGLTWIELTMGVAIVGILAGLAMPSHGDRTKEKQLAEVLATLEVLAESACEHHAAVGSFSTNGYIPNDLWSLKHKYASITAENFTPSDGVFNLVANFTPSLDLTRVIGSEGILRMELSYHPERGYIKTWDTASTIDGMYMPRQSGVAKLKGKN